MEKNEMTGVQAAKMIRMGEKIPNGTLVIGNIDLRGETIKHSIFLDEIIVDGDVLFILNDRLNSIRFLNMEVVGNVSLRGVTVDHAIDFEKVKVRGSINLAKISAGGSINLSEVSATQYINLIKAKTGENLVLDKVTTKLGLDLTGVSVKETIDIHGDIRKIIAYEKDAQKIHYAAPTIPLVLVKEEWTL